ncbi:hypothetical protein LEP1GSC039_2592 [Leptospira santarosai str. 2000027870]|nr:hypothetical protein LEP1GSC039_2592 [Leptospira santarosai str. 2000027870]
MILKTLLWIFYFSLYIRLYPTQIRFHSKNKKGEANLSFCDLKSTPISEVYKTLSYQR